MKKDLKPRNWKEQRFIAYHRAWGTSEEEISRLLKNWRFTQLMCSIIAAVSLFLYGCLMTYILFQMLFIG